MSESNDARFRSAPNSINRREFIKNISYAAVGGGLSLSFLDSLYAAEADKPAKGMSKGKYKIRNYIPGMAYMPLGRTNLMVSRLSLGGIPWEPTVAKQAIRQGVNLVHGSNRYGSMEAQSEALAKLWDKCWYVLKHQGSVDEMGKTVDTCLKTLNRDHVEMIVPVVGETKNTDYEKIKSNFEKLKKAGKVRSLGVTVHTKAEKIPAVCREVIEAGIFDIVLTMYQPANKEAIDKELVRAVKNKIGTMSMKTGQGVEKEDIPKAIGKALADGAINTVLKGIGSMNDLNAYLKVVKTHGMKIPPKQARVDTNVCGACGGCSGCPENIAIQEIMRCATYYGAEPGLGDYARQMYQSVAAGATVAGCGDCGECEKQCPRNLPIRQILRTAHEKWSAVV